MNRDQIGRLLLAAHKLINHREYVILGSLSILGAVTTPPEEMTHSIDVDLYPRLDPGRADALVRDLGQGSLFEEENGFYADPVAPAIAALPEGWEGRVFRIDFPGDVTGLFVHPNDVAVSKYARLEDRDRRWLRAGLKARILDGAVIEDGMNTADFLDAAEQARARAALREDMQSLLETSD